MTIYFCSQGHDRIKIGYTSDTDPQKRKKGMQTGSGYPLVCLGVMPGDPEFEQMLHYCFSEYNIPDVGREWFWLVQKIRDFIEKFATQYNEFLERTSAVVVNYSPQATNAIHFLMDFFTPGGPAVLAKDVIEEARKRGLAEGMIRKVAKEFLNIDMRIKERSNWNEPAPWYPPEVWPVLPGFSPKSTDDEKA